MSRCKLSNNVVKSRRNDKRSVEHSKRLSNYDLSEVWVAVWNKQACLPSTAVGEESTCFHRCA